MHMLLDALTNREDATRMFHEIQQLALKHGVSLPSPPDEPTSCCGRGCNGCVWEGYFNAADYWRSQAVNVLKADIVLS